MWNKRHVNRTIVNKARVESFSDGVFAEANLDPDQASQSILVLNEPASLSDRDVPRNFQGR